jgi:Ca2+-transporting ATPase|tara:strand:+ start:27467 stop:27835 length:369 start_codon:yes stop_codon:yes gene_type:complete
MPQPVWHSIDTNEVLQRLDSSATGLTTEGAQKRLAEHGPNTLPEKQARSLLTMVVGQFSDFMSVVLLIAALISGFIDEPQDTIAILVIVLLNARAVTLSSLVLIAVEIEKWLVRRGVLYAQL